MASGSGQIDAAPLHRFPAVFEIATHGSLSMIEIERDDIRAAVGERHGDMHGRGGFARSAFLIGEHDPVRMGHHRYSTV
jgi:hypothetical protein